MTTRPELLRQLNKLKRDERALKTEELGIRQAKSAKDPREQLARNHELRMKNKRHQGLVTRDLRAVEALEATLAAQAAAQAAAQPASGEAPPSPAPIPPAE
jgi:hypothetical protein